ncbi:MAG TPA: hypothetical protein VGR84_18800 [Candidatus Acidoferrales bacterium]|nr:hypothetical protein [Candidatus Acidoferrales bacterium]
MINWPDDLAARESEFGSDDEMPAFGNAAPSRWEWARVLVMMLALAAASWGVVIGAIVVARRMI